MKNIDYELMDKIYAKKRDKYKKPKSVFIDEDGIEKCSKCGIKKEIIPCYECKGEGFLVDKRVS